MLLLILSRGIDERFWRRDDVVAVYDDGEDRGSYVTWLDDLAATATGEYRCVLRLPSELAGCVVRVDAAYLKGESYRNAGSVNISIR